MKKLFMTTLATAGLGLMLAPAAMAKNDHVQYQTSNSHYDYNDNRTDHNSHSQYHGINNQNSQGQWQSVQRHNTRDDNHHDGYDYRNNNYRYQNVSYPNGYNQLPSGLQKNIARGKAVPPGWAKKLNNSDYRIVRQNGRDVYILDRDVYNRARVIGHPRAGVVQLQVNNRTLEVIELTRTILSIL